ncbi:NF-kappa-B inhibitor zeta isoform 2-T2 [Aulostomus maculatus]
MLEPAGEISGSQKPPTVDHEAFAISYPRAPRRIRAAPKKNTVKELLLLKRQRLGRSRDDGLAPACKSAKTQHPSGPPTGTPSIPAPFSFPEEQLVGLPSTLGPLLPAEAPTSLFQWQVEQEVWRLDGVHPEMVNMQDADGDTCLHIAVAQGKRPLAFALAGKMATSGTLELKERNGQTALQLAATADQHLIVRDLLSHGALLNTQDLWGRSPLHVCAEKGHFLSLQSMWRTLSGWGQPVHADVINYDGLTPLHTAVLSHNAVVRDMRPLGNSCSYAARELALKGQTYARCIHTLLDMGASCGTKDLKSGRTCLHMACEQANVELMKIFLDLPMSLAIVNVQMFNGNTALHVVCSLRNPHAQVEAAKLLMRRGANPGARNAENEAPSQMLPEGPVGVKLGQLLRGK